MTPNITLRPYVPEDYEFVYGLKKLCYHDYVEALWGWDEEDQRSRFAGFMAEGAGEMTVILLDGDTLDICNLCLLPEYRGRGIGGKLLRQYIAQSTRPILTLQVYKNNPARRLYERLGFQVYEETDTHYRMKLQKEV